MILVSSAVGSNTLVDTPLPALLVGESNPYGGPSYFALYPEPYGCAGWRLCHKVMQLDPDDYLERFDRTNLCAGAWRVREARACAVELLLQNRKAIVLCGSKVAQAFGLQFAPFTRVDHIVILPHPSGLCRLWSQPNAYERARAILHDAGVLP